MMEKSENGVELNLSISKDKQMKSNDLINKERVRSPSLQNNISEQYYSLSSNHLRLWESSLAASAAAVSKFMDMNRGISPLLRSSNSPIQQQQMNQSISNNNTNLSRTDKSMTDWLKLRQDWSHSQSDDMSNDDKDLLNNNENNYSYNNDNNNRNNNNNNDDDDAIDLKINTMKKIKKELQSNCSNNKESRLNLYSSSTIASINETNGKSFPCSDCHKTFATEVDLKAHLMRHVTQHPFVCLACGKGFKYDHTLDFHIKSQHGVDSNCSTSSKTSGKKLTRPRKDLLVNDLTQISQLIQSNKTIDNDIDSTNEENMFEDNNNNQTNAPPVSLLNTVTTVTSINPTSTSTSSTTAININNNNSNNNDSNLFNDLNLPPNLTPRSIQIKSEKVLITMLEGFHPSSEQTYILYKCCLCGFAFPCLEPVMIHVQTVHSNQSAFTCEKCGATFKWRSELQLHDQLHKAMDQQQQQNSKSKSFLMPSFLQPNLMLMNPYFGETLAAGINFNSLINDENNVETNQGLNLSMNSLRAAETALFKMNSNNNNNNNHNINNNTSNTTSNSQIISEKCESPLNLVDNKVDCNKVSLSSSSSSTSLGAGSLSMKLNSSASSKPFVDNKSNGKNLPLIHCQSLQTQMTKTPIGDIEETAPGQFKCRFCEKTFDRIFSVHRHERVHTGYKPCICRVCGRGFSEKRNLRHHIIRFHSDGSGRELLKRVRKEKSLSAASFLKKAAVKYLSNNYSENGDSEQNKNDEDNENNSSDNLNEKELSAIKQEENISESGNNCDADFDKEDNYNMAIESNNGNVPEEQSSDRGSSRRKNSRPSKKVMSIDDDTISQFEARIKQEASESDKGSESETLIGDGEGKDNSNENESKFPSHGAFFSSYNPRLGIVEKPIKRSFRPLIGPDGKYLYPCGYCQKTFCSLSDLNRHMNFHEDVRPFKCEFCDYQSRTNSQLKVHMLRHAGIKQYLCQICNYNGVTQSDLNRHCKTRSHLLRSANVCPLCSLGFSTRVLLEDHVLKFHETSSLEILQKEEELKRREAAALRKERLDLMDVKDFSVKQLL